MCCSTPWPSTPSRSVCWMSTLSTSLAHCWRLPPSVCLYYCWRSRLHWIMSGLPPSSTTVDTPPRPCWRSCPRWPPTCSRWTATTSSRPSGPSTRAENFLRSPTLRSWKVKNWLNSPEDAKIYLLHVWQNYLWWWPSYEPLPVLDQSLDSLELSIWQVLLLLDWFVLFNDQYTKCAKGFVFIYLIYIYSLHLFPLFWSLICVKLQMWSSKSLAKGRTSYSHWNIVHISGILLYN